MRRRADRRRSELINDPMIVEIRGESFNYSADITDDPDGVHLRAALTLLRDVDQDDVPRVLGTPQEVESAWEAVTTLASQPTGER